MGFVILLTVLSSVIENMFNVHPVDLNDDFCTLER